MKKTFPHILILSTYFMMQVTLATTLNLYEEPNVNSKKMGSINSSNGVISIYTPKNNKEWTKIADPTNGNVGWVKSSELNNVNVSTNIIKSDGGKNSYQIIQYGNIKPYTKEEIASAMKQFELRQEMMQKNFNRMLEQFNNEWFNFPMMMPVIVVPQEIKKNPSPEIKKQNKETPKNVH